jgi:hypothetical protein
MGMKDIIKTELMRLRSVLDANLEDYAKQTVETRDESIAIGWAEAVQYMLSYIAKKEEPNENN